jgi:signal peptidase
MWYIILIIIAVIYGLINFILPNNVELFLGTYIVQPILWIILAFVVFIIARNEGLNIWNFKKIRKWEIGKNPLQAAILIGGFQVSLLIIIGLFVGFGRSPYLHTPFFIIINTLFFGSALVAIELSRAYLIKKGSLRKKNITITLFLVTLLFMFITISSLKFTLLDPEKPAEIFRFLGEAIIPGLAISIFASYLAYLGGALPAIGYMGIIQGFEWFSPYLPALEWTHIAFIGTVAPAVGFLIIQNSVQFKLEGKRFKRRKMKDPALPWMAVALVCILLIFFTFGYFGTQPTVIYSGSMRPNIDVGDVVLVSEVPIDELSEGDIIQYRADNMSTPIIHRILEINNYNENILFITKGDANNAPDRNPIHPSQIMGKVIFNLPKIGWVSIAFKEVLQKIGIGA